MAGLTKNASIVLQTCPKFLPRRACPFSWGPHLLLADWPVAFIPPPLRGPAGCGPGKPTSTFFFAQELAIINISIVSLVPTWSRAPTSAVRIEQDKMPRLTVLPTAITAPSRVLGAFPHRRSFLNTTRSLTTESTGTKTPAPPEATRDDTTPVPNRVARVRPRQLTYLVGRTATKNICVYNDVKSGGTRKFTIIRKIEGNAQDLKQDLINELRFKKDDVNVNPVTGNVHIKVRVDIVPFVVVNLETRYQDFPLTLSTGLPRSGGEIMARGTRILGDQERWRQYGGHATPLSTEMTPVWERSWATLPLAKYQSVGHCMRRRPFIRTGVAPRFKGMFHGTVQGSYAARHCKAKHRHVHV